MSGILTRKLHNFANSPPDPYWANVVFMSNFVGTNGSTTFVDQSSAAHTVTANGNAQITTAQYKFPPSSGVFDGTGDYLTSPYSVDYAFGMEFTMEGWVRFNSTSGQQALVTRWNISAGIAVWLVNCSSTTLDWAFYTAGPTYNPLSAAWTHTTNTWYYIAVDRDSGGVVRLYADGTMLGKQTMNGTMLTSTEPLGIGWLNHPALQYLNGWLGGVRITKGVARYASDSGFTPPTAPFPTS